MTVFVTNNTLGGTQQSLTTTYKTLVTVLATTGQLRRVYIDQLFVGTNGTINSTDCQMQADLSLVTAEGTATAVTPTLKTALETGTQSGCLSTSKANHTVEPTITSNSSRLNRSFNQRGFLNWAALTDDDRIVGPAVAANGWSLRVQSTNYASTAVGEIVFRE